MATTMPFLAMLAFNNGLQTTLSGILKGYSRQVIAMPIVIMSYWFVDLSLAYYDVFVSNDRNLECQCRGLCVCGTAGLVVGMVISSVVNSTETQPRQWGCF